MWPILAFALAGLSARRGIEPAAQLSTPWGSGVAASLAVLVVLLLSRVGMGAGGVHSAGRVFGACVVVGALVPVGLAGHTTGTRSLVSRAVAAILAVTMTWPF